MRNREEIEESSRYSSDRTSYILEALLDIRDLLEKEKYPNRCLVCGERAAWLTNGLKGFGDYCDEHRSLQTNKESK